MKNYNELMAHTVTILEEKGYGIEKAFAGSDAKKMNNIKTR